MPPVCPELETARAAGERYYYTGKPCRHGHVGQRHVGNGGCVTCDRGRKTRRSITDTARLAARSAGQATYQGSVCERGHKGLRYVSTGGCVTCRQENGARWYNENREHSRQVTRSWRASNPDRDAKAKAKWHVENIGLARAYNADRRARKRNARPKFGQTGIPYLYAMAADLGLVVDHEIPLKHSRVSGLHVLTNLRLLSKSENSRKHNIWEGTR